MQKLTIQKQQGFSLIELMVIIIIVGILAAIVYPNYLKYALNARLQNAKADVALAQNMLEKYYAQRHTFRDGNDYPVDVLSQFNNEFFNIGFYAADGGGVICAPGTLSADQYCLYAAPKSNNDDETRFVFVDGSGIMQVCEQGGANISNAGVLTNKHNATGCTAM